jgi:hypothetical protein
VAGLKAHNSLASKVFLNMAYTPAELAKEIGFTRRQVYRVYEPLGCPFERDETGHYLDQWCCLS